MVQYADDTTILVNFNSKQDLEHKLDALYVKLYNYLEKHKLCMNNDKTEIMIINELEESTINFGRQIRTQKMLNS